MTGMVKEFLNSSLTGNIMSGKMPKFALSKTSPVLNREMHSFILLVSQFFQGYRTITHFGRYLESFARKIYVELRE